MQSFMTFNKETEVFEQNVNVFPLLIIMTSYFDDFSKMRSYHTLNLVSSHVKHLDICLYQVS